MLKDKKCYDPDKKMAVKNQLFDLEVNHSGHRSPTLMGETSFSRDI